MVRVDENGYPVIFEARSLAENQMYEFWVSASTSVGEGEPTSVIAQATNTRGKRQSDKYNIYTVFVRKHSNKSLLVIVKY
ncbi:hypothetical protein M5D96_001023 [Drosophila gunungcola]|uniref:Uncharacterized protein n=1 Tax=Drosophila gunungcola TaxID=103775 RepID=A0A9P9YXV3_9MUSC|nr:hypothetical protein M5D96_001023 [Drosophila gunungcola]